MNMTYYATASVILALWVGIARASADAPRAELSDGARALCEDVLARALEDESPAVRVHAAEALTALGRAEPVVEAFRPKGETAEPVTRILVWRVLAAAEPEAEMRRGYVERIRSALLDPSAPDWIHAMESLAKLNEPAADAERRFIRSVADGAGPASPFALWRLVQAGEEEAVARLVKLLHSTDSVTRIRAAYVLGRLRPKYPIAQESLTTALVAEPTDSPSRPMLRAAAGTDMARELLGDMRARPGDRYFAAMFLADTGAPSDYRRLTGLLHDPHHDLRVSAAYALLKINARAKTTVPPRNSKAVK